MKKGLLLIPFLLIPLVTAQDFYHPSLEKTSNLPLILVGMFFGLIDGIFNPCALSVILFMVAYMLALGSRRKILKIGIIYSTIIFLIYFSFMYLLINGVSLVSYYIGYSQAIRYTIGIIVITVGIIDIKDFFFYGKFFSIEIPKFAKPKIERLIKSSTVPSAILLGILVSLVEIPCAGAFPLSYAYMISKKTHGIQTIFYLCWYNLFFVAPLFSLILIFYFGFLKVEEVEKKRVELRKFMRLIAGIILILFGISFFMGWI
ncbi:MAG: cytochrome c biogenesis protein CcdA [Candidatus Aenigmatarchaeota archaeon]